MMTLARRVGLYVGASCLVAGVVVAVVAAGVAEPMVRARDNARLREAATTLAHELGEPGASIADLVEEETREVAHTGIRFAVFEGDERLAGYAGLQRVAEGECLNVERLRHCAVRAPSGQLVVAASLDLEAATPFASLRAALAIAVLVVSALAIAASGPVARRAVRPLLRLHEAVSRIDPSSARAPDLGSDEKVREVDALRAALQAVLGRLGVSLEQATLFASNAAHELRTPLSKMLGETDLLLEQLAEGDPLEADLRRIRRSCLQLATLVDRLLVMAAPSLPGVPGELVAVEEVVEDVIAALPAEARARVSLDLQNSTALEGDRPLIATLIGNGVENALKHTVGPVHVRLARRDGALVLQIDDEGAGIPMALRERMFQPFYRGTSIQRRSSGSGIGLALVRHIAARHRGTARFCDGAIGARLEIELPTA